MGYTSYSVSLRSAKAARLGYADLDRSTMDTVFTQNTKRMVHESMDPKTIKIRESRDSETHPNSVPIILALDLTGSMRDIPLMLLKNGLPKIMGNLIQKGLLDPSLLFLGVGDTTCDHAPLQVGQFESGDDELDTWLTRTYVEGGGGGNEGESYLLAWYFAAMHTATDAFEKRGQKGFLFTIGDEPSLKSLPKNALTSLMNEAGTEKSYSDTELLEMAKEKYNVYHFHIMQGSAGSRSVGYWKELLGSNCIVIEDYEELADKMVGLIVGTKPRIRIKSEKAETKDSEGSSEEML
jgi:hypothetical protein